LDLNELWEIKKAEIFNISAFFERLAATYSRGSYTTTTIGPAVFDGRVRNGNGSDHRGIATKLFARFYAVRNFKEHARNGLDASAIL
jgi:hypothetical protein